MDHLFRFISCFCYKEKGVLLNNTRWKYFLARIKFSVTFLNFWGKIVKVLKSRVLNNSLPWH